MQKLYIHIGLPKTATSSIQNFLFSNTSFLNKHGYQYMNTGLNTDLQCHHDLIWSLGLHQGPSYVPDEIQKNKDRILKQLADENKQHSDKHLIISSELLTFLDDFKKLEPILTIFEDRDIRFIVNLRRQDTFLESLYQQVVKDGVGDTFQTWYSKAKSIADYNRLINSLLQITHQQNITIGIFNSAIPEFNPTKDFLSAINLHDPTIMVKNNLLNERLPANYTKIIRFSNRFNLNINYALLQFFSKYKDRFQLFNKQKGYLNHQQRAAIKHEYSASNKALTEQIALPNHIKQEILSW